ncbi:MAG: NmrA family NAD(P)-binding protein [Acidobacteria bacterium]|nr:NmrA family NAD(P)-binding protein [Acidobacteriota bacterium]
MFIVAGVSGNTGRVVADTLLAQRQPVTVVVRDAAKGDPWRAKGATVATLSLDDSPALTDLLSTAQGAYLLCPPNNAAADFLADRAQFVRKLATAVQASAVPHIVFLSSVGAQHAAGTGPIRSLHHAEELLAGAARGITFLRAAYFFENWASGVASATSDSILHSFFTPGRAIPMISTTDIGRFAAEHLLSAVTGPRIVEISGPAEYTPEDIAAAFGKALNRSVHLVTHPAEAVVPALLSFGVSPSVATLVQEMYQGINSGHVDYERNGRTFRRGTVTAEEAIANMIG